MASTFKSRPGRLVAIVAGLVVVAAIAFGLNRVIARAAEAKRLAAIDDVGLLIVEAKNANAAHDIEQERKVLDRALGMSPSPEEQAEIERRLAVLDWKYHARYDEARARLRRIAAEGVEPDEAWLALARLEHAADDHDAAIAAARKAVEEASTAHARRIGQLAVMRSIVARSVNARLAGRKAIDDDLRTAFEPLDEFVRDEPGYLEPSRSLLRAALLLDRGDSAWMAWQSYFHVGPGIPAPNAVSEAGERLGRQLESLRPDAAEEVDPVALIRALADSRLFVEAALVALDPRLDDGVAAAQPVKEIVAYAHLLESFQDLTDEFYRKTTLGRASKEAYLHDLEKEAATFFESAGGEPVDRDASVDALREYADARFGALIQLGKTAGYFNLHMGHRVVDTRRTVEQYGHRAEVRFIMLDTLVSNGFQSWAWESGAAHGGWGEAELIVQIRPAYVDGPLMAWRDLDDAVRRQEEDDETRRETELDEERARTAPHGYLPGLAGRLRRQGEMGLLERLEAREQEVEALRMAFVNEMERATQESSIFAHEGRHAIDKRNGTSMRPWKKEYTAKLSEVAFAPEPRLALGGILNPNIGSDTPHGQANLEIMEGLVAWMKEHTSEIDGFDATRPVLPQLDRLTDDQLRAAFRSMDAMAR